MTEKTPTSESLKDLGNDAVKNKKYEEAILHYTHAIKIEPNNFTLYSNRSFAFLKLQQYYYALEDANSTIQLNPEWPKGYFRKAEIEFATNHFNDALNSYEIALCLKPLDETIIESVEKTKRKIAKDRRSDEVLPWLGAGIGIILGVIIVIADTVSTIKPTHPILMVLITIAIAMSGYGLAKAYRYYIKAQHDSLLEPPFDLLSDYNVEQKDDDNQNKESTNNKSYHRFTKFQARQRYKKGKM